MRVLGVDYGQKRIGLALSDPTATLARPWKTVARSGNASQVARALADILDGLEQADEAVEAIVVGLPRRLSGDPSEQTSAVQAVAEHLRRMVGVPVLLQDERLSSHEAETLLARREKDWRKRKAQLDAMSPAILCLCSSLATSPRRLTLLPSTLSWTRLTSFRFGLIRRET